MKIGDLVRTKVELNVNDSEWIMKDTLGTVTGINPRPSRVVAPAKWFGVDVRFDDQVADYPCDESELELI